MAASGGDITGKWHFWIDRGGTFTDVVARAPDGHILARKAPVRQPRRLRRRGAGRHPPVPRRCLRMRRSRAERIGAVKMGTTVATNALLERKGDADRYSSSRAASRISSRSATRRGPTFSPSASSSRRCCTARVIAGGRARARRRHGRTAARLRRSPRSRAARDAGIDAVAIVLMHAYAHPEHERQAAQTRARAPVSRQVSASHEVSPLIKIVPAATPPSPTPICRPILRRYVDRVSAALSSPRSSPVFRRDGRSMTRAHVLFMASSGGLKAARAVPRPRRDPVRPRRRRRRHGRDGEARGLRSASSASTWAARPPTCRISPASTSARSRREIAGVRMRVPMLRIHTVAAGGGSILTTTARASASVPTVGRRQSGAEVLPPRRPAHRHRRQRHARQARRRRSSRRSSGPNTTSRSTLMPCARPLPSSPPRSATAARRRRSPTASSALRSRTWPTPSRRSRSQRGYDVTDTR